jgi:hypothetical protein
LVQKSHYQSANITKINSAIEVYRGLANVESIKSLVLAKLKSMLLHNYTKVRIAAAEVLALLLTNNDIEAILLKEDWSRAKGDLKIVVDTVKIEVE